MQRSQITFVKQDADRAGTSLLLALAGVLGLLVAYTFAIMRTHPVAACTALLISMPVATVLNCGHLLGLPLSRSAKSRIRTERALEAMMQILSAAPLLVLLDTPIG